MEYKNSKEYFGAKARWVTSHTLPVPHLLQCSTTVDANNDLTMFCGFLYWKRETEVDHVTNWQDATWRDIKSIDAECEDICLVELD